MSNRVIKRIVEHEVVPTAEELADAFWSMGDDEQAIFFSRLAEVGRGRIPIQLEYVTHRPELTADGRRTMSLIGEYSTALEE